MNISDLKNINLDDLKNINIADLKNIDLSKLKTILERKQSVVLNAIIVIVSFFFLVKIFIGSQGKINLIKSEIQLSDKRNAMISKYDNILKERDELYVKLPEGISGSSIINYLTDFAEARDVHILTFSSAKSIKSEFYERSSIALKISVNDYSNLILFVQDIEDSGLNLRVDKWVGTLTGEDVNPRDRGVGDTSRITQDTRIVVAMDVSSIKFIRK